MIVVTNTLVQTRNYHYTARRLIDGISAITLRIRTYMTRKGNAVCHKWKINSWPQTHAFSFTLHRRHYAPSAGSVYSRRYSWRGDRWTSRWAAESRWIIQTHPLSSALSPTHSKRLLVAFDRSLLPRRPPQTAARNPNDALEISRSCYSPTYPAVVFLTTRLPNTPESLPRTRARALPHIGTNGRRQ